MSIFLDAARNKRRNEQPSFLEVAYEHTNGPELPDSIKHRKHLKLNMPNLGRECIPLTIENCPNLLTMHIDCRYNDPIPKLRDLPNLWYLSISRSHGTMLDSTTGRTAYNPVNLSNLPQLRVLILHEMFIESIDLSNLPELRCIVLYAHCFVYTKVSFRDLPELAIVSDIGENTNRLEYGEFKNLPRFVCVARWRQDAPTYVNCPNAVTEENISDLRKKCALTSEEKTKWMSEYATSSAQICRDMDDFWVCIRTMAIYQLRNPKEFENGNTFFLKGASVFYVRAHNQIVPEYDDFEKRTWRTTYGFNVYLIYEKRAAYDIEIMYKLQGCSADVRGSSFVYPAFFVLDTDVPVQDKGGEKRGTQSVNILTDMWVSPNARGMKLANRILKSHLKPDVVNAFLDGDAEKFWKKHDVPSEQDWDRV